MAKARKTRNQVCVSGSVAIAMSEPTPMMMVVPTI
jgi:hypothetical protein